jgi:polysaccharide export outer membrane protein
MFKSDHTIMRLILALAMALLPTSMATEETTTAPADSSYVLRPNDAVRLSVYEEPDLSVSVRILTTGEASFPLIGSVKIGGLSVAAATRKIHELYAKDYLVDPKVTLTIDGYADQHIWVIGAVKNPGQIPIPAAGQLDMASAMATVGGLAEDANAKGIQLVRALGGTSTYSLADVQGANGSRIRLEAGDRIIVQRSPYVGLTVMILGQVGKPGPIGFPASGRLDLVTAISMSGGLTPLANPKKVTINRKGKSTTVDYREISQRGDQPYMLQPDDVITVAERIF